MNLPLHRVFLPLVPSAKCLVPLLLCLLPSLSFAQEAMFTEAATMPSKGVSTLRPGFHVSQFGTNPLNPTEEKSTDFEAMTSLQYGIARAWSVTVGVPAVLEHTQNADGSSDWDKGISDLHAMFKYRVYMDNPGGVDTTRIALLGGATFASGDDSDFSSGSINPMLGAVITIVRGRHGFNQDIKYTLTTGGDKLTNSGGEGPADALELGSAYVYRILPAAFTSETEGAWYTTLEVNTMVETSGDLDIRWSPGLMYEGRLWAFETMLQFPLYHELDERAELDWSVGVGFRFTF
jgi:hypothetical protein